MSGTLDFFDTVVIIGVIQGILGAIAVGYSPSNTPGKKLLTVILITLTLLGFKILLHTLGLWQYGGWHYFPLAIDTLIQPLFYLYTCSLTKKSFSLTRKQLWHFAPVMFFESHAIIVYLLTLIQPDIDTKDLIAERYLFYNSVKWAEDIAALFLAGIYWYLCYKRTQTYRQWLFTSQSATQYSELNWLRNLFIGTGILVAMLLLSSLPVNILQLKDAFPYMKMFYIYLTLLIYFLSFQGYRAMMLAEVQIVRLPTIPSPKQTAFFPPQVTAQKTTENEADFLTIQSALKEAMEQQLLFMEPELSLKDLAKTIGFPVAQVSAAINVGFGQNFRSWVNGYRVEEVKKRLNNPMYKQLSLTGIAFECGFNSEASFYRIFRQHTGQSPKTYLQELKSKP